MGSKEEILRRIKENKGDQVDLPVIPKFLNETADLHSVFEQSVITNAGKFFSVSTIEEVNVYINNTFKEAGSICSMVHGIEGNLDILSIPDPHQLQNIDLTVIHGALGVAENAAIWIPESHIKFRALPFITQHLIVVLSKKDIVQNMHAAYDLIKVNEEGYGVFIAGPSKTADIEQNLVIGAHGSRSHTVFLV